MIDITMRCYVASHEGLTVRADRDTPGGIMIERIDGKGRPNWFTPHDARNLYDALGAHLGITSPAEPDALTRIAAALEKLASFATADGLAESARIP